ncbi:MAG TPA: hypothetical protein VKT82_01685 [Ktedonobacterales bacterium]|nr:hypothetical protein [Ktedonobacterales bacterium]
MSKREIDLTSIEVQPAGLPVLPLKRERVDAYLGSKHLYERLCFAGVHDRCLLACAWLFDHPGAKVSIGSDAAMIDGRCYRLAQWQQHEVSRLDAAFPYDKVVTKRQYIALGAQRQPRRKRVRP